MTEAINPRYRYVRLSIALLAAAAAGFVLIYILPFVLFAILIFIHPSQVTELQRIESPDQLLDSVVTQIQPGFSIESDYYRVYIALASSHRLEDPVLEIENAKELKVMWLTPKLLQISYAAGCIDTFHSQWSSAKILSGLEKVEILLKPPEDAPPHRCD